MTSTPSTPKQSRSNRGSRTPSPSTSPALDPVSPLVPISPWPPIPSPLESSSEPNVERKGDLPNATDVYSSIAILGTYILFSLYLVWAFSPEGISWLDWMPDRQWAIIVPCWLMVVVLLTYWSYAALVIYRTPDWNSIECITDPYANIPSQTNSTSKKDEMEIEPYYWEAVGDQASSQAIDLPIDLVDRVIYQPRRRKG
ncbi:uncharacterized protein L201_002178 [Kwoniella dendrophila CBS 6074]|uniref:PIG-P domain-containing protein n=1 Tax=Kwoniella dendrophila CBS 6074 TaxID=1295534 RepID=A0AAX4JS11_9TREE